MKSFLIVVVVVGLLILMSGITFAFQGVGLIGGAVVPYWINLGALTAIVGLVIAALGWYGWKSPRSDAEFMSDFLPVDVLFCPKCEQIRFYKPSTLEKPTTTGEETKD